MRRQSHTMVLLNLMVYFGIPSIDKAVHIFSFGNSGDEQWRIPKWGDVIRDGFRLFTFRSLSRAPRSWSSGMNSCLRAALKAVQVSGTAFEACRVYHYTATSVSVMLTQRWSCPVPVGLFELWPGKGYSTAASFKSMYLLPRSLVLLRKQQSWLGTWKAWGTRVRILSSGPSADGSFEKGCYQRDERWSLGQKSFVQDSKQDIAGFEVEFTRCSSLSCRPNLPEKGIKYRIHSVVNHEEVLSYVYDRQGYSK